MHILAVFLLAVVGAGAWYWRLKTVHEAGSEIIDSIATMRGAFRRRQFRNKADAAPLASIRNPAIAAIVTFILLAKEKPYPKDESLALIKARMAGIFTPKDLEEVIVFAQWAAEQSRGVSEAVRIFRDLFNNALTISERGELLDIAQAVAEVGGPPLPAQEDALRNLRTVLHLN